MNQENEFDNVLAGVPKEAVREFLKPGELSEAELTGVMAGPERAAIVEEELKNEGVFRASSVEQEKAMMFDELAQTSDSGKQATTGIIGK